MELHLPGDWTIVQNLHSAKQLLPGMSLLLWLTREGSAELLASPYVICVRGPSSADPFVSHLWSLDFAGMIM